MPLSLFNYRHLEKGLLVRKRFQEHTGRAKVRVGQPQVEIEAQEDRLRDVRVFKSSGTGC